MVYDFLENFSIDSPYGWKGVQQVNANRLLAQTTVTRGNGPALKVSVQPTDQPIAGGANERNEFLQMFNLTNNDINKDTGAKFFAFSLFIPSGWQDPQPRNDLTPKSPLPWAIIFQLHGPDSIHLSPPIDLDILGSVNLQLRGGESTSPTAPPQTTLPICPHMYNTWVDLVMYCKFAPDSSAQTVVWYRPVLSPLAKVAPQQPSFTLSINSNLPNIYSQSGVIVPHYIKSGLYRTQVDGLTNSFTNTFYRSRLCVANTFEDAAMGAFW